MVQARPAPKAAYTPARHLSLARDGWPGRALPWHVADAAPELWCGGWTGPPGLIGIASSTHSWSWLKIFFFGGLPFLVSSCFLCIVSRLLEDRAVLAPLSLLYLSLARSYLDALIEIDSERGRSLSLTHQRLAVVRGVAWRADRPIFLRANSSRAWRNRSLAVAGVQCRVVHVLWRWRWRRRRLLKML